MNFIQKHPGLYLTGCLLLGAAVRLAMAGGDLSRWLDPTWIPLIHQW